MKNKSMTVFAIVILVMTLLLAAASLFTVFRKGEETDCVHSYQIVSNSVTCTEAGEKLEVCSLCGLERTTELDALGHDYRVTEHKDARCEEDGVHVTTCTRCAHSVVTTSPKLAHTYVLDRESTSTCTEGGERVEVCTLCGREVRETFAPTEHELENFEAKAATCVEIGYDAYEACKNCGYSTRENIPAIGHAVVVHEAVASTCSTAGNLEYMTCMRCEYSTYEALPLSDHVYENGFCKNCNRVEPILDGLYHMNVDEDVVFSADIPVDATGFYSETVKFTGSYMDYAINDPRYLYFDRVEFNIVGDHYKVVFYVYSSEPEMNKDFPIPIQVVTSSGWVSMTEDYYEALRFNKQAVSEEFYDWFMANATKVS